MGFWSKLFGTNKSSKIFTDKDLIEEGVCPNCWGQAEYDGQYLAYAKDQTKSNINKEKTHQKAFIQQFVETNVTGIKLKRENVYSECPGCKAKYKHINV